MMKKLISIYGINPCGEFIQTNPQQIKQVYISNSLNASRIMRNLESNKLNFQLVTKQQLFNLVKTDKHQGIVIQVEITNECELTELITLTKNKSYPLLVLLDQIEDPHNLGAIFRSCEQYQVDGIIMLNRRQTGVTSTVIKASSGAALFVKYSFVNNLTNAINKLKDNGFWIYVTNLNNQATRIDQITFDRPTLLVLGNEGKGVSKKLSEHADFNIHIPTFGQVDSLNVSVACGIILYQIRINQKY